MKVFDFTNGRKGKLLGDTKKINSSSGWFVKKGDDLFKVELAKNRDIPAKAGEVEGVHWEWASGATQWLNKETIPFTPEQFGVEAICFCTGRWNTFGVIGSPEEEWTGEWMVLGTNEWNRSACKSGILKATKQKASDVCQ